MEIYVNTGIKILHAIGELIPVPANNSTYVYSFLVEGGKIEVGDILVIEARFHRISGTNGSIYLDFSIEASPSGFTNLKTLASLTTSQYTATSRHVAYVYSNTLLGGLIETTYNPYLGSVSSHSTYTIANIQNDIYFKFRLRNANTADTSQLSHLFVQLIKKKI